MENLKTYKLIVAALFTLQFLFWFGVPSISQIQNFSQMEEDEQFSIWAGTKSMKPEMEVLPKVPSKEILKAFSLGDEELAFSLVVTNFSFAGDTFGRVTPLKDYDYDKLYRWWMLLDEINSKSDILAFMVAYYFSASQTPEEHVPYVVDFLEQHSDKHPVDKWWWYAQAVYNAKFKLDDDESALRIAKKLASLPPELDIPIWTRQLEAFIYEKKGEYEKACDIIVNVIRDFGEDKLTEGEMNFIYAFITERLEALVDADEAKGIKVSPECREIMKIQKASEIQERSRRMKN